MGMQILQEPNSAWGNFGAGLGQGLAQSIPSISDMILNRKKQQQINEILFGTKDPQKQVYDQLNLEPHSQGQEMRQERPEVEITPEKIFALQQLDPALASTMASLYKGTEKAKQSKMEEQEQRDISQKSFDRMSELLKGGKLGFGSKARSFVGGGQTAEDVGEFESLSGALEAMLVDKVSRGTLSNARFKYITETLLPKPTDRQATIKGKMKALAKELNLNPDALERSMGKSSGSEFVLMKDPQGNVRRIPRNQAKAAQQAGGKLVK